MNPNPNGKPCEVVRGDCLDQLVNTVATAEGRVILDDRELPDDWVEALRNTFTAYRRVGAELVLMSQM